MVACPTLKRVDDNVQRPPISFREFIERRLLSLPGQAPLDFEIQRKAEERSDQDDSPKDANNLRCRRGGDGADDVSRGAQ